METDKTTQQRLAASLTAESTELLPYLEYLLQDLWALGGSGDLTLDLLRGRLGAGDAVLDLACGKGAVSLPLAKALGVRVTGVDLLPGFVAVADQKAVEWGVVPLCRFVCGDANQAAEEARDYACVIFSAAGDVLGPPPVMLQKLAATVRCGGYVVLDESYLPDGAAKLRYQSYPYLTRAQWDAAFAQAGLAQVEMRRANTEDLTRQDEADLAAIARRAEELARRHPDKAGLFRAYVQSQQNEAHDVENSLENVVWLLRRQG